MTPEFSRTVRLDTLGASPRTLSLEADEAERTALAARFGLASIERLAAEAVLIRNGETVTARGTVKAAVTQSCAATGDPVEETVEEPFRIEFRPHPESGRPDEEIELGESELDVIFYDGPCVDIGEAVAETLSLNLDPYPRSPHADEALRQAGVKSEEEARAASGPFSALAALKSQRRP